MLSVKKRVENYANHEFRTCVCIYYPDGNSGETYHSDEVAFGNMLIIPSISLGEERQFNLRAKASMKESVTILEHGSLLLMKNGYQEQYEHSFPLNAAYKKSRINLTFRQCGFNDQL
jgi:alkylated DNA repair dioxygenase AlkB